MRKTNMSRQPAAPAAEGLEAELTRITGLGLDELRALWRTMARRNPPAALSRDMLARMVAYMLQEQRLGKLAIGTRKLLDRLARGGSEPVRHLKVGTVMVREHRGTLHEVMVVPDRRLDPLPDPDRRRHAEAPASAHFIAVLQEIF